jgi:hypothetical protein
MNEKVNDKTKEEIMPFTPAFQRQLVAMLLADKEAPKYIKLMKPKYFDNPVLRNLVILIISFFNRYSRPPTRIELLEEVDIFLEKDKGKERLPVEEYMNISQKVLDLAESDFDFEPTKDKAMKFIQHQAFERAIMKSGEELLKDSDYEGIMKEMNEAASIGSLEDGALRTLSSIEPKDVAWLWESRIPLGEITLLVGDPGVGKSYFSYFLSAQISKGGSWPDAPDKPIDSGKILILSTDEDPNYAIRPRSDAAGADVDKITVLEGSRGEKGEIKILNLTKDIYRMEEIFKKNKEYRLWIIDTLTDYLGRLDSNKYSDVRWALIPVLALARKYNVAIVGILHCNKNTSLQVLYRIMGSMGFAAVARSIWIIAKDRDDEENKRRYFAPLKNNLAPPQKPLAFRLENLGKVAKVVFEDKPVEDSFDIEEVLVPQERAGETKRAKKFLLDILKDGAMATKEIKSAARNEDISWGTLKRAKDKMSGVKAIKDKGVGGKWFWDLDEFTRGQALAEADAEPKTIKERVEERREKHKSESEASDSNNKQNSQGGE